MAFSILWAPLAVATIVALWLTVQRAWSRAFPELGNEPDALAARPNGSGCGGCADACERRARGACRAGSKEET